MFDSSLRPSTLLMTPVGKDCCAKQASVFNSPRCHATTLFSLAFLWTTLSCALDDILIATAESQRTTASGVLDAYVSVRVDVGGPVTIHDGTLAVHADTGAAEGRLFAHFECVGPEGERLVAEPRATQLAGGASEAVVLDLPELQGPFELVCHVYSYLDPEQQVEITWWTSGVVRDWSPPVDDLAMSILHL